MFLFSKAFNIEVLSKQWQELTANMRVLLFSTIQIFFFNQFLARESK